MLLRCDLLQFFLGSYHTEAEAARAYDRASLVFFGMQGHTNVSRRKCWLITQYLYDIACMLLPSWHALAVSLPGVLRQTVAGSLPGLRGSTGTCLNPCSLLLPRQFPASDYARELPDLLAADKDAVVKHLRTNWHAHEG